MERNLKKKSFNKITVASHDAGGAEIICAFLKKKKLDFFPIVSGPAIKIFKKHFKNIKKNKIGYALDNSDYLLTGSSIKSKHELNIIIKAKKKKLLTKTYLDHWINYKKRFVRNNKKKVFPDQILVGDVYASKTAKKVFPKLKVILINNPSWEMAKKKYKKKKITKNIKILFASSYFKKRDRINPEINFTGPDMVKRFLNNIKDIFKFEKKKIKSIIIRHHPRETKKKYLKFVNKKQGIFLDNNTDFLKSISQASHIVGCESMMAVYAKIMGKKTININIGSSRLKTLPRKFFDREISLI